MAKRKTRTQDAAMQWKVVKGVQLTQLERTLEEWSGKGWRVFQILGPLNTGFSVVVCRMLTL